MNRVESDRHPPTAAPRRGHYVFAFLFFAFVAIYGSVVPLEPQPLELETAVATFRESFAHHRQPVIVVSRTDWATNVLLFIPIGYCAMAALLVDRKSWRRACLGIPIILLGCFALSISIEFAQLWFPPRVPSFYDIEAQTIGTLLSSLLWLAFGQHATNWMRSPALATGPRHQLDWILQLYVLGLVAYAIMPLDLSIQPDDLYQKFKNGRIELIPFSHPFSQSAIWELATNALLFVPIGAWATKVWTRQETAPRAAWISILIGAAVVFGIEVVELFVISRTSSATQVISGTTGVVVGVWLMRRWLGASTADAPPVARPVLLRLLFGMGIVAYSAFLCAVFWWPMALNRDGAQVRERLQHFWSVPFASCLTSGPFNAITDITRKLLLFGILGFLWAGWIRSFRLSHAAGMVAATFALLYGVALATGIELCQAAFPPHVPDASDVLIAMTGIVPAMFFVLRKSSRS